MKQKNNIRSTLPEEKSPPLISTFSIAIPACTLLGMGIGTSLPEDSRSPTLAAGVIGLLAFVYFQWKRRDTAQTAALQHRQQVESRLLRHTPAHVHIEPVYPSAPLPDLPEIQPCLDSWESDLNPYVNSQQIRSAH